MRRIIAGGPTEALNLNEASASCFDHFVRFSTHKLGYLLTERAVSPPRRAVRFAVLLMDKGAICDGLQGQSNRIYSISSHFDSVSSMIPNSPEIFPTWPMLIWKSGLGFLGESIQISETLKLIATCFQSDFLSETF